MIQVTRQKGFTIIELTLSMAFVSVLLLAIVMTSIQAGRIYNKGVVLESVNQASRDIGDSIRRDFMQSDAAHVSQADGSESVIILSEGGEPKSGRFCLGEYSYLWNYPSVLEAALAGESVSGPVVKRGDKIINFVRVVDDGGSFCASSDGNYETNIGADRQLMSMLDEKGDQGVVLAIHELGIEPVLEPVLANNNSSEALFRVNYTIGTSAQAEINGQQCRPPADSSANDQFCAINQFEMIVRTNG